MSYDIPPPLQHKEKIMFGLTFPQLGYAFLAFIIIFILVLKTNLHIAVSGTISLLIIAIASFFMFFDGRKRLISWYNYLRNPKVEVLSDQLKKIVDIKKVKDDAIQKSKSKLAILEVIPMNFMLKTEEEKESIIITFQKFLNSLDFPIQIHISSNPISLSEHLRYTNNQVQDKIKETKDKSLNKLINSYCKFVKSLIQENNIQNRNFYIIIQEKDNLDMQVEVCKDKLTSLGVKVKRLKTPNILNMLHQQIANNKDKEFNQEEIKDLAHFMFAPDKVNFLADHFKVDDKFCKVIAVTGYPYSVEMGFMDKIISSGDKYDISLHIEPFPLETTMVDLNRDLQKQLVNVNKREKHENCKTQTRNNELKA